MSQGGVALLDSARIVFELLVKRVEVGEDHLEQLLPDISYKRLSLLYLMPTSSKAGEMVS